MIVKQLGKNDSIYKKAQDKVKTNYIQIEKLIKAVFITLLRTESITTLNWH